MATQDNNSRPDISHLRISPQDKDERPTGRWVLISCLLIIVMIVSGLLVYFFNGQTMTISVAKAESMGSGQELTILNASGYVTPRRRATIAAKITGQIIDMQVEEGMHVKKDQILARFDDSNIVAAIKTLEAEVAAAEAAINEIDVNLKNAQRNFNRNRSLHENGIITTKVLDDSRALYEGTLARRGLAQKQIAVSQARLWELKKEHDNYTIRAPFEGIAVSKDAQVGEIVSPISAGGGFTRTGIATIVDMDSLEIEVDINEYVIAKVTVGQKVTATLDAYPNWHIPAHVRTVIPTADRQKATVKVRIAIDERDPKILPDMGVKVSFIDSEDRPKNAENHVLIPLESIRKEGSKSLTFIYKNGYIESRPVQPGPTRGQFIEILAGIVPGEQVTLGDLSKLYDGQKVRLAPGQD